MTGYVFPCLLATGVLIAAAVVSFAAVGLVVLGVRTVAWLTGRAPAPWALVRSVTELDKEEQ